MKAIAINGSPKGSRSNTAVVVQAFLRGIAQTGAETEEVYLAEKAIHQCTGCFSCWFKTPGRCVHNDDMPALLAQYRAADMVCFATPVYTWNMTALLKNYVDRLAPLKSPLLTQSGGDFDLQDTQPKTAQFVVIANAGFPGENNFATMRQVFAACKPVLEIYRNCGMALKKQDERVDAYLQAVQQAGAELAATGTVSDATKAELSAEMIPLHEYVQMLGM